MRSPDRGPGQPPRSLGVKLPVLVVAACLAQFALSPGAGAQGPEVSSQGTKGAGAERLVHLRRSTSQDQGAWVIDYQLRYLGPGGVVVLPSELRASVEGWVS